jgi:phosphoenolpyruvate-protein kinase (PTS system EI component)
MGIPTIVGVAGLTARLRTGQRVRMDGGRGTVEVLSEKHNESASEDLGAHNHDSIAAKT